MNDNITAIKEIIEKYRNNLPVIKKGSLSDFSDNCEAYYKYLGNEAEEIISEVNNFISDKEDNDGFLTKEAEKLVKEYLENSAKHFIG